MRADGIRSVLTVPIAGIFVARRSGLTLLACRDASFTAFRSLLSWVIPATRSWSGFVVTSSTLEHFQVRLNIWIP